MFARDLGIGYRLRPPAGCREVYMSGGGKGLSKLLFVGLLGTGTSCDCLEVQDEQTGQRYALKVVKVSASKLANEQYKMETQLLRKVSGHPNVIELVDTWEDPETGETYLVLPVLRNSLTEVLLQKGPLTEDDWLELVFQLASGLEHVHSQGIVHR